MFNHEFIFADEKIIAKSVSACLLDIEGTTTSISFVKVCLYIA